MDSPREAELLQRLQESQEEIARLGQENALLRQKIDLLVKRIFGASSEKLDAAQLELLLASPEELPPGKADASSALLEEAAPSSCKNASRRRGSREARWPADLPIIEEVIEPPEVKVEPQAWRKQPVTNGCYLLSKYFNPEGLQNHRTSTSLVE